VQVRRIVIVFECVCQADAVGLFSVVWDERRTKLKNNCVGLLLVGLIGCLIAAAVLARKDVPADVPGGPNMASDTAGAAHFPTIYVRGGSVIVRGSDVVLNSVSIVLNPHNSVTTDITGNHIDKNAPGYVAFIPTLKMSQMWTIPLANFIDSKGRHYSSKSNLITQVAFNFRVAASINSCGVFNMRTD